jgi:hypothetical protein
LDVEAFLRGTEAGEDGFHFVVNGELWS